MEMKRDYFSGVDGIVKIALQRGSSFCIVSLWILVTATVLFRFVPIFPMGWSDEIVELLFAWMVFSGAADLCRQGKHFIVDLIPNMIAGTRTGHVLAIVIQLLALAFLLVFTYEGAFLAIKATDRSPVFELPKTLWYMVMPIAGLAMIGYTIRDLRLLIRSGRRKFSKLDSGQVNIDLR
jgi:TRAP-type C4-dicarboxylate transport system permease small subunit